MPMLLVTMKPIGGKNPFLVIGLDYRMEIIHIHTAQVSQSALFQTIPKLSTKQELMRNVKGDTTKL